MTAYRAPLHDMQFVINELAGLANLSSLPGYEEVTSPSMAKRRWLFSPASKFFELGFLTPIVSRTQRDNLLNEHRKVLGGIAKKINSGNRDGTEAHRR